MTRPRSRCLASAVILIGLFSAPAVAQPTIVLDYSFDTNNFFPVGSTQRATLQAAATRLTSRLTDTLSAIVPDASNTWTPNFSHPGTGALQTVTNPTIAANTIIVYAGGRELGGSTLGVGGFGGYGASGFQNWFDLLDSRGQSGALASPATDFGPWGGSISFDSVGTNWNFNLATGPASNQSDFYSVALHELGHLLGIGTADSWDNLITGTTYNGPVALALAGTTLTTTIDKGHWISGTGTTFMGQEAAMTPSITVGTRKDFTELDFAGLDDLGWQVTPVPEPTTILGVVVGVAGAWSGLRRLRRKADGTDATPATAC